MRRDTIDNHIYNGDLYGGEWAFHTYVGTHRLARCPKEFGGEARPATFPRYFCRVKTENADYAVGME